MSKLINRLSDQPEEPVPTVPRAQQLDLLGPLPISVKDPPSITASIPPRNNTLARGRNKPQAEPILSPPAELEKLQAALADAEGRMETLRLEILSLQDSREGERKSRLAGEQRIRELEEQLSARPGISGENSVETRQALDETQTQLDDLRSQFRHLEGNHEEQAHKAEQRVIELTAALEREKNELNAARMEIDRLSGETETLQKTEGFEEELFQARLRVEELETRLCSEAEIRSRAERNAIESQSRLDAVNHATEQLRQDQAQQAETAEGRIQEAEQKMRQALMERDEALELAQKAQTLREQDAARFQEQAQEAEQKVRQAMAERDEALGLAQKAQALREQEVARFQERERLSAQRVAALRRVESPASTRVPTRALSALPVPWPLFLVVIVIVCGGGFLLGRWQGGSHPSPVVDQTSAASLSPATIPGAVTRPLAPKLVQWPAIKGNFIRVQTTADRMTMVFEYAVFSRRTEIQPDALRDLQKLARQLAPLTLNFRIEITGHTDADQVSSKAGEYANNQDLGLKRAQAVREALIRQGGLPPESMTAVSAGDLNPPYPNTTPEQRKKNRTVTISLIPK